MTNTRISFIIGREVISVDITKKIRLAEKYAEISEAELARRIGTSSQALGQRLKTGKLSSSDLDTIAAALGAEFECHFVFPDGTKI